MPERGGVPLIEAYERQHALCDSQNQLIHNEMDPDDLGGT